MNLSLMELRHLRYFLGVAEAKHFTRAAAKMHVTQPTLSHQIRQLEGQLNLRLFDRVGRRVELTAAGELLLPHARRVMKELAEAESALLDLHGLKRGKLRVGIMQTVNSCVIPEIVAQFSSAHHGVRVTCHELSVEDIEAGLESGKLDLGISFMPPRRTGLQGEWLFTEELVAVVRQDHALAQRRSIQVRELGSVPLVLLAPNYCTRQLIDRAFAEARLVAEPRVEMNSVESILSTVRSSGLVTILPVLAMCRRETGLAAVRLTNPEPKRAVGLLWAKGFQRRAAAEVFAKTAEQTLRRRQLGTDSADLGSESAAPPRPFQRGKRIKISGVGSLSLRRTC